MLSERLLTNVVRQCTNQYLKLKPTDEVMMPAPEQGKRYMLYMHVPFCERLCPYCSFNRFPFSEERARPYFENMRKEMRMLKDLGYDFDSVYIGGGTPTIMNAISTGRPTSTEQPKSFLNWRLSRRRPNSCIMKR